MSSRELTRGFLYVATGHKYIAEACKSLKSLRHHHPSERVCIATNDPGAAEEFDDLIVIDSPVFGFADKLHMARSPYDYTIFIDTDMLVLGDLSDLFALLDRHDLAAKLEVYPGLDYALPSVPSAFIEYNTGLVVFHKTPRTLCFFEDWSRSYFELRSISDRFDADQPSFRQALYRSDLRHCSVPTEYHLQADMGAFIFWTARLIHCHHDQELAGRLVNKIIGPRVYMPGLGVSSATYSGLSNFLGAWCLVNWQYLVGFIRKLKSRFWNRPKK